MSATCFCHAIEPRCRGVASPPVATLRTPRQAGQPGRRRAPRLLPLLLGLALAAQVPPQAAAARLAPITETNTITSSSSSDGMSAQQAATAAVRPIKAVVRGQKMMVSLPCLSNCPGRPLSSLLLAAHAGPVRNSNALVPGWRLSASPAQQCPPASMPKSCSAAPRCRRRVRACASAGPWAPPP